MLDTSSRSWTLLAVEGTRQYGGNAGYLDAPTSAYRFDSGVANGRHVKSGDLAFIRNRDGLVGVAQIETVHSSEGEKELMRCPVCHKTGIHQRRTRLPLYRCNDGHEFEDPDREIIAVTKYVAHYGGTFVSAAGALTRAELRSAAVKTNDQMSIEEINVASIADVVVKAAPATRFLLEQFFQRRLPDSVENDGSLGDGYHPGISDRRNRVLAAICARRGQAKFRRDLVRRYGPSCAISGCTVMPIIEAAHVWPYRGEEDNHPENGLLLRADLHTLYDLDLIGIDKNLRVSVSEELKGSEYEALDGRMLTLKAHPSKPALDLRWASFAKAITFRAT